MTIIFLVRLFYPHIGGVEKHTFEIGKRLIKKGHRVIVITEKFREEQETASFVQGIKVYRMPIYRYDRSKKFRIWLWLIRNRELINKADVVHCHDVFFWYLPFRFLYPHKPVYTTFHGYEGIFPPSKKAILIRKLSEKLSKGKICVGDYIEKWYGTKPTYISYGGVDYKKIKNKKLKIKNIEDKLKILLIGRLENDIGVSIYLRSLELLRQERVSFSFEAIGGGNLRKQLEEHGRVHGFVSDISDAIRGSDVVFCSSYLTILEVIAHGKIAIAAYTNPLKRDYLVNSPFARFILICKDELEVVSALHLIIRSPWKFENMKKQAALWVRDQTWDKVIEMYEKLWHI